MVSSKEKSSIKFTELSWALKIISKRSFIANNLKRFRGSQLCLETERQEKPCYVNKCPQDCVLSIWGEWEACSQTCGTGKKTRRRTVGW